MKKIFLGFAFFAFTTIASAQVEKNDSQQDEIQDKIQQEPTRDAQTQIERSAQQSDVNTNNNKNVSTAGDKLKLEKEKSTGKESKNPALNNQAIKPVQPEPPKQRN